MEYNPLTTIYHQDGKRKIIQPEHKYIFNNRYLLGFKENYIDELDGYINRDEYRVIIKRVNRICSKKSKLVVLAAIPLYLIKAIVFTIVDRNLPFFYLDFLQFLAPIALVIGLWYYIKYKIPQRAIHYINQINNKYDERGIDFDLDIDRNKPPQFTITIHQRISTPPDNLNVNDFNSPPQLPFPQIPYAGGNMHHQLPYHQQQPQPYVVQNNTSLPSPYPYPSTSPQMYSIPQQSHQPQYAFVNNSPHYLLTTSPQQPFIDSAHPPPQQSSSPQQSYMEYVPQPFIDSARSPQQQQQQQYPSYPPVVQQQQPYSGYIPQPFIDPSSPSHQVQPLPSSNDQQQTLVGDEYDNYDDYDYDIKK